jgi:hypothetical protein
MNLQLHQVHWKAHTLQRGTTCLSQEYPEEHDPPGSNNVGERLGRVELLLEKLVSKITQYEEEENAAKIATPESMGSNDVLTPYISHGASNPNDAPILSLFDNEVVSHHVSSAVLPVDHLRLDAGTINPLQISLRHHRQLLGVKPRPVGSQKQTGYAKLCRTCCPVSVMST